MSRLTTEPVTIPISEMDSGYFWSRSVMDIGGTDDDLAACKRGDLPADRVEYLAFAMRMARNSLASVPVAGWNEWKPLRLMVH